MTVFAIIFFGDEHADVMQRLYDYYPNFYRLDETTSFLKSREDVDTVAIKLGLKDHAPTAISEVPACIFQLTKNHVGRAPMSLIEWFREAESDSNLSKTSVTDGSKSATKLHYDKPSWEWPGARMGVMD